MAKSKTLIEKQSRKKNDPYLVRTLLAAKKREAWKRIAELISGPKRIKANLNLGQIDQNSEENESVVIPGKVLSEGEVTKNIKIVALSFSEKAKRKISESGCKYSSIAEEISSNPEAKKVRIMEGIK